MTALQLAVRMVRRSRAQMLLAIAGVAVIGALLFDMLLLSHGLLLSFSDMLNQAGFDVRIVGGGTIAIRLPIPGSAAIVDRVQKLPEVRRVAVLRFASSTITGDAGNGVNVGLIGTSTAAAGAWTMVSGQNLDAASSDRCPIVVSARLANRIGPAGTGVMLTAKPAGVAAAVPAISCRVVGTARFLFDATRDESAATTLTAFRRALGETAEGDADLILVASSPDVAPEATAAAIRRAYPGLAAYSNDDVVRQFNTNGFAYFRQISIVLSSMTMVFAFLLVATLLTVSVNQRLGEIAALRAIGIGRRRIAAMLLWESVLLVGAGGLLALPLGELLALGLDRLLRQMPGLPETLHFFVFEPRAVVVHVGVLAVTAIAAAAYPVWLTARIPIAATLRRETIG